MNAAALSWCFSLSPAFSIQACGKTRCGRQCSSYLIKGTANSARGWTARRVRSARGLHNIKHKTREEGRRINAMDDDTKARDAKSKEKVTQVWPSSPLSFLAWSTKKGLCRRDSSERRKRVRRGWKWVKNVQPFTCPLFCLTV